MASSDVIPLIQLCLFVKLNVSICKHFFHLEMGDNSKSIDARVIYLKHDVFRYHTLSMDEISLQ